MISTFEEAIQEVAKGSKVEVVPKGTLAERDAEIAELKARLGKQTDYSGVLQRVVEALAKGNPLPPKELSPHVIELAERVAQKLVKAEQLRERVWELETVEANLAKAREAFDEAHRLIHRCAEARSQLSEHALCRDLLDFMTSNGDAPDAAEVEPEKMDPKRWHLCRHDILKSDCAKCAPAQADEETEQPAEEYDDSYELEMTNLEKERDALRARVAELERERDALLNRDPDPMNGKAGWVPPDDFCDCGSAEMLERVETERDAANALLKRVVNLGPNDRPTPFLREDIRKHLGEVGNG